MPDVQSLQHNMHTCAHHTLVRFTSPAGPESSHNTATTAKCCAVLRTHGTACDPLLCFCPWTSWCIETDNFQLGIYIHHMYMCAQSQQFTRFQHLIVVQDPSKGAFVKYHTEIVPCSSVSITMLHPYQLYIHTYVLIGRGLLITSFPPDSSFRTPNKPNWLS